MLSSLQRNNHEFAGVHSLHLDVRQPQEASESLVEACRIEPSGLVEVEAQRHAVPFVNAQDLVESDSE